MRQEREKDMCKRLSSWGFSKLQSTDQIQSIAFSCKLSFIGIQAGPLMCILSMAAFMLQWHPELSSCNKNHAILKTYMDYLAP